MRKTVMIIFSIVITFSIIGCATGPKFTWKLDPHIKSVDNESFSASITPTAYDDIWNGYTAFNLTIRNKTPDDIEIDWNKTLFIMGGQTYGGFMFAGVLYKDRNNSKQPDVIFSGSEFRKTIYPNDLVDFLYRQWRHYAMPEGDNGVYLSLKIKDNTVREKITVRMVKTPVN